MKKSTDLYGFQGPKQDLIIFRKCAAYESLCDIVYLQFTLHTDFNETSDLKSSPKESMSFNFGYGNRIGDAENQLFVRHVRCFISY